MRTAVVLVAVVLLGGCSPAGGVPSPRVSSASPSMSAAPSVSASPSPSPTVAPSFPAVMPTQGADNAAIIAGWQEYWRVYEKYASDPFGYTDFTETQYVTTGEAQSSILDFIGGLRDKNLRALGGVQFRDFEVSPVKGQQGSRTAILTYCALTSGITVVDATTGEPADNGISDPLLETVLLEEGKDGKWRVARIRNEVGEC